MGHAPKTGTIPVDFPRLRVECALAVRLVFVFFECRRTLIRTLTLFKLGNRRRRWAFCFAVRGYLSPPSKQTLQGLILRPIALVNDLFRSCVCKSDQWLFSAQ